MIKIYVANLGKYNEGELVGEWLELPTDMDSFKEEFLPSIEIDGEQYEEYAIHDFETDIEGLKIGEYDSIEELNDLAETMDGFEDYEQNALMAFLENGCDIENAIDHVKDGDFYYFHDCDNMADVAERYCEECGLLESIPENLRYYFDFEAYGRYMDIEGTFISVGSDYIQLIY